MGEDKKGKGGTIRGMMTTRGSSRGYAGGRDSRDGRDRAYTQEDTHHHSAQGTVPPGQHAQDDAHHNDVPGHVTLSLPCTLHGEGLLLISSPPPLAFNMGGFSLVFYVHHSKPPLSHVA
jgi:hypothetical protein